MTLTRRIIPRCWMGQAVIDLPIGGSLPYHRIIHHVPLLSEEEAQPFQIAIAITLPIPSATISLTTCPPMVCACSAIWTIALTISSTPSCAFHDCYCRRRKFSLWRLFTQLLLCKQ